MSELWQPKEKYRQFNLKKDHIDETCGRYDVYIPYKRLYAELTQEQLLQLINDAKINRWQALDLTSCGLEALPDELWDMPDLQMLYLGNDPKESIKNKQPSYNKSDNTFTILPRKIESLTNLRVLSLTRNIIKVEGDSVLQLPTLLHLDIYNCGFRQVPECLLLPTLEEIGFNCLEGQLSETFMSLKRLRRAYFADSRFIRLPESFGSLMHLEQLYLFRSKITALPISLKQLRFLSRLSIFGTPLAESLPPEILKQSAKDIVRYILSQQSGEPKQYFNESKMVIVGQGHVGKSSLINRLVNNAFSEGSSTEGIDISSWYFMHGKQSYKLNVWDFGGQEIYHSTHQFFLTKRSLYLLVWDALAEDEYGRIDYWLKTIQSLAADSPIIIVVNKCDHDVGRIRHIDEDDYKERFPQIKTVVYVSCKDNIGISKLKSTIKKLAVRLPLMKTSWLSSWMAVRNELETLSKVKNYIPYSEYLDICKSNNVDYDEARSLIRYLHDLGIVLYYHDDPLLKNIVILSSEWGTDAVYKVLDEQERTLKGRNGILHTDDLPSIWKDTESYPTERYPYLLNLMKKFQIAFEISSTTYLVAELLDTKAIDLGWYFDFGETLSFRYEYDFLPAGIMTRFIVSINRYLETINGVKQCWKKGAYLRHRNAYAFVRLYDNITDRYIHISVSGVNSRDKQELLTIIREKLDEIHSQFIHIKIVERIPCICSADCKFLFDYATLLRAEEMGKATVECHLTLADVDVKKLLDGVESHMNKEHAETHITINNSPQFSPQMIQKASPVITNTSSSTASASTTNTITVEIKNLINGMHGDFNDLKDEVSEESQEFNEQCNKVSKALGKLDTSETKDDITKSGAMKKIERFLMECHDPETKIGKLLAGVKHAADIVKDLTSKYNKLAKWVALPQLPFGER